MITNDIKAKDTNDKSSVKIDVKPAAVSDKKEDTKETEAVKKTV